MDRPSAITTAPLALTMGCPAGIGPEILCKLFATAPPASPPGVVIGDVGVLRQAAERWAPSVPVVPWQPGSSLVPDTLPVYQAGAPLPAPTVWGRPEIAGNRIMGQAIKAAVRLVQEGLCCAMVTCPISKQGLQAAGYAYPGHTEMLAALTETSRVRMMMAGPRLKVVLATIHVALCRVPELLSQEEIVDCIRMTHAALQHDFGLAAPRIAVAGLNPHGGEGGLFGDEEARIIEPAVRTCGCPEVSGPWPPDTVFHQAAAGRYDAVIALYHDQGLIPFKLLHFADGVNVTLGLPLVRTSVDHGTAYAIAGTGQADPSSLAAAVAMAGEIVANRRRERI